MQPDLRNPLSFGEVVSSYVAGPQAYNFAPVETWLRCGSSMLWLSFGCVGQNSWWYHCQKTLVKIRLFTFSFGMMLRMYDDLHEVRMEQNRDKMGKWEVIGWLVLTAECVLHLQGYANEASFHLLSSEGTAAIAANAANVRPEHLELPASPAYSSNLATQQL